MSTRNISCGVKAAGAYGLQPYHFHVPTVMKSGTFNLLEPSGPLQACNGTALPLPLVKSLLNIKGQVLTVYTNSVCVSGCRHIYVEEAELMMALNAHMIQFCFRQRSGPKRRYTSLQFVSDIFC